MTQTPPLNPGSLDSVGVSVPKYWNALQCIYAHITTSVDGFASHNAAHAPDMLPQPADSVINATSLFPVSLSSLPL
ncbi:hypothetical protein D9619_011103 [Psilocybe cf. subviscida]|uniref:Uncharacterized protein n=1 Tax=Psilocybe cf. subviscida TaxID=2480587 RepID=A0A8H5BLK4_9AGAR|nr:hypothetical protein D9619_011103 [Psilocybe cf. subviscida]